MKTTVDQKSNLAAVKLNTTIARRSTLPILESVLIRANGDSVSYTTTDLDSFLTTTRDSATMAAGACAVPAKRLVECLASCKGSVELESTITVQNIPATPGKAASTVNHVNLAVRNVSSFTLAGFEAKEFPPVPNITTEFSVTLPAGELVAGLKQCAEAISTDQTRYVLQGIAFDFQGAEFSLVATDGRRLHLANLTHCAAWSDIGKENKSYIVPAAAVKSLLRILAKHAGNVAIEFGTTGNGNVIHYLQLRVTTVTGDKVEFVSKLIDGNYPNFRQVIPCDAKFAVCFDRAAMLASVTTAGKATSEKSNSVKLTFAAGMLTVSAKSEKGEAAATCPCNYHLAGEFSIGFNPEYLAEALSSIPDREMITADFVDELSPIKFHCPNWLCVVMPMRLK